MNGGVRHRGAVREVRATHLFSFHSPATEGHGNKQKLVQPGEGVIGLRAPGRFPIMMAPRRHTSSLFLAAASAPAAFSRRLKQLMEDQPRLPQQILSTSRHL